MFVRVSFFSGLIACGAIVLGVAHAAPTVLATDTAPQSAPQGSISAANSESQSVAYFCIGQTCTIRV